MILQLSLSTLELACFFGLLGLAYLIVLEGSGFFNLALGPYAMIGALSVSTLVLKSEVNIWLALLISLVLVIILGILTEVAIVRPIERRGVNSEFTALVAVAALVFGLSQGAGLLFGRLPLPGQQPLKIAPIDIGGAFVTPSLILVVVSTLIIFIGIAVLAKVTAFGRALRAVGDNRGAAKILGLPVSRVRISAFVLSALVAFVAGIAFASKGGIHFDVGLHWALLGFLALVIGGTGSWFAPLIGGLLLALTQVIVPFFVGGAYTDYAVLVFALIFFALRPQGIYSRKVRA